VRNDQGLVYAATRPPIVQNSFPSESVERGAGERLEQCRANAQLAVERDRCLPDFTVSVTRAVRHKFSDVHAQLLDYEAGARDFVFKLPQEAGGLVVHRPSVRHSRHT
jgi:hypothetical protein